MSQDKMKQVAAQAAIDYLKNIIDSNTVIGVGTGSTTNYFIEALAKIKHMFDGAVPSSGETEKRLKEHHIPIYDLNAVQQISVYVDGADEINKHMQMIKGGGGALTREKIIAAVAQKFVCIADESKYVDLLGTFPLPIEVIPMARSYVARELVKLGGDPVYREGVMTDNNNIILDLYNLKIVAPVKLEEQINQITGVVTNGLFAKRKADKLLLGTEAGVKEIE